MLESDARMLFRFSFFFRKVSKHFHAFYVNFNIFESRIKVLLETELSGFFPVPALLVF